MMGRNRSIGLAANERQIAAAEVASARSRPTVTRAATFEFPDGVSWQEPAELGRRLGAFLREHGMARAAVVGMPAAWLMTAAQEVPPVSAQDLAGVLRLAAERAFSMPPEQMVCDYASAPPEGQPGTALLVAARRDRLDALAECARAAGLKLRAVTSTAVALATGDRRGADAATVYLAAGTMDVVLVRGGQVVALRHVPLGADERPSAQMLHLGLQSVLAAGGPDVRAVEMWDGLGLDANVVREAGARLGVTINREPALPAEGLAGAADARATSGAGAVPLALIGLEPRSAPFNLLAPRLAVPTDGHWRRYGLRAALAAVALLAVAGALIADRGGRSAEVAALRAKLEEIRPSAADAQSVVDVVNRARGWYDRRPPVMDCLLAVTGAFPEQGRIWATSLGLREDMRGMVAGKSTDERAVLDLLDAMKSSSEFADVKLLYQEKRGTSGDVTFAATFTYVGGD